MNLIKHLALVSAVALAPSLALAQAPAPASGAPAAKGEPGKGGPRGAHLRAADKDGDGALSKAEAEAAGMKRLVENFDKLDANKDGKVTREEMRAARGMHGDHHKGDGKGPRGERGERMKAADKDGDGALSKAEAEAAGMKRLVENFDKLDANKDGKVTREEMRAARPGPRGGPASK
ncbi:MAG: EF-hand domain-containing protein [Burkholderiales bacterium]|nr:EF-hand domain-containing protein [Burkholderiales bacterium]